MLTLVIMADDFTGALDTGVKFAQKGASVRVVTDWDHDISSIGPNVQVAVIDTESRHISRDEAFSRIYKITANAVKAGVSHIYKKTDSALRGNIGGELEAVLRAAGGNVLHFIPAFPVMGRITKDGHHYVDDVPLDKSVFGRDPFEPVKYSSVEKIISTQSTVPVKIERSRTAAMPADEPYIAVYDAENERDLRAIANSISEHGDLRLLAGCAGMAEYMPAIFGITGETPELPKLSDSFLVVCGSVNAVTQSQLAYAQKHGFTRVRLSLREKLVPSYYGTEQGKECLARRISECLSKKLFIIDTNDNEADEESTLAYAKKHDITLNQLRVQIASVLGFLVREIKRNGAPHVLMITGGDTLLSVMGEINVNEMTPVREVAPGTILSSFTLDGKSYYIISKSGGFGRETLFCDIAEELLHANSEKTAKGAKQ